MSVEVFGRSAPGSVAERAVEETAATDLAGKLEGLMRDPQLNIALGPYMSQLILPGMVEQKRLTPSEAERILQAGRETLSRMLTPKQRSEARLEAQSTGSRQSPFVR